MDIVYLCTSAYSVLCFFYEMDYYSVWTFIWSEYFGIPYATSTSYTAINMTAEGVYRITECIAYSAHIQVYIINYEKEMDFIFTVA